MSVIRLMCFSSFVLFTQLPGAYAENTPNSQKITDGSASADFSQVLYKGVVGNVLEKVPMDAADRVTLQRTNAVVSNILSGRSLSMLANITNPALLIGSIVWGLWSASNINPPATAPAAATPPEPMPKIEVEPDTATDTNLSLAANSASAPLDAKPILLAATVSAQYDIRMASRPNVIKIWPSQ